MKKSLNRGFTLIEVLVAVLVMSVGLLGVASLQVSGIRTNRSAYLRSQAVLLAYDMMDRMRANFVGLENGHYDNLTNPTTVSSCYNVTGCSAQDMAQDDVARWLQDIQNILPNGGGLVCLDEDLTNNVPPNPQCDPGTAGIYSINIWWNDSYWWDAASSNNQTILVESFASYDTW